MSRTRATPTHCANGHPWAPATTRHVAGGGRRCTTCTNEQARRRAAEPPPQCKDIPMRSRVIVPRAATVRLEPSTHRPPIGHLPAWDTPPKDPE